MDLKLNSGKKLLFALIGALVGFNLPEIFNFIASLFGG